MNHLKEKMSLGKRVYGTAIVSPSTMWCNVVKQAKLDFVFLDTEHVPLGRETLSNMCNIYSGLGITPIVRIPSPDPYSATIVLDGGASAILAPYIETMEQVKQLVGATKFRPIKGLKLKRILDDEEIINEKLSKYIEDRCANNLLFLNIESKTAVDNLSELLSVNGIDGVIIGPHDLSCSLEIPEQYGHPVFEKYVKKIIDICLQKKIGVGIHLSEDPKEQIKWAKEGINIILHSSDISLFNKMLNNDISLIKENLGDLGANINRDSIII